MRLSGGIDTVLGTPGPAAGWLPAMVGDKDVKERLGWTKPMLWALVNLPLGITLRADSKLKILLLFWRA